MRLWRVTPGPPRAGFAGEARAVGAYGQTVNRVLSCRPAEMETKFALAAVSDLLESVPEEAFAVLPAPQRRALEIALLRVEPGGDPVEPRAISAAVRSLLVELSDAVSLLVAVDDMQWLH